MYLEIHKANIESMTAKALIAQLDSELLQLYPREMLHVMDSGGFHESGGFFFQAMIDGTSIGCAAIRPYSESTVEIKRMFILPKYRGQGYSRVLLSHLEKEAQGRGYRLCLLETGKRQPEALGLYRNAGYSLIAPFGEYKDNPTSVCFEKWL